MVRHGLSGVGGSFQNVWSVAFQRSTQKELSLAFIFDRICSFKGLFLTEFVHSKNKFSSSNQGIVNPSFFSELKRKFYFLHASPSRLLEPSLLSIEVVIYCVCSIESGLLKPLFPVLVDRKQ